MYVNFYDPLDNKLSILRLLFSIQDAYCSFNKQILNVYQKTAMCPSSSTTTRNKYAASSVLLPAFRPPLFFGFLSPPRFKCKPSFTERYNSTVQFTTLSFFIFCVHTECTTAILIISF
jgi:hypothetical protein